MDDVERVRRALASAERVVVLTGAGVSAASGIPTFRGARGLWRTFRPEELATAGAFARDPQLVWEWYDWRRQKIREAQPNAAHDVLAAWTRDRPGFTLVTQNVDGLHERAGAARLIRLHGSIWQMHCWDRCLPGIEPWLDEAVPLAAIPPRCRHCHGLARPGVVWFGESLDSDVLDAATTAAGSCEVFLSIGTSAVVYPAAGLLHSAKRHGAMTVEINTDITDASDVVDIALRGAAEDVLTELSDA